MSFAEWSTNKAVNYQDVFDVEYNDDGSMCLASKQTFTHDEGEGGMKFEYKLALRCTDLGAFVAGNDIVCELLMMPLPKYWNVNVLREGAKLFGWDNEPTEKLIEYFNSGDAHDVGCTIKLSEDSVSYDPEQVDDGYYYDITDCPDAVAMLNEAASVCSAINEMRGFALDKAWNAIGSTGWDVLNHILYGSDTFRPAIDRYLAANA